MEKPEEIQMQEDGSWEWVEKEAHIL